MSNFLDNFKEKFEDVVFKVKTKYAQIVGRPAPKDPREVSTESGTTYEINLVPAVKIEMIKAQKMRNRVLFSCILISCVAFGIVVVLFGVKSGQDIAMASQDKKLERLSEKLNSYTELSGLVKIQNQLAKYDELNDNKKVLSRAFGALGVMLPQGEDEVKLSELRANLDGNVVTMEGQVDARTAPLIDYRVLESFKKGVGLTKYDYGRYTDVNGEELPTQCISEADENGNAFREGDSYYAIWDLTVPGCEAIKTGTRATEGKDVKFHYSENADVTTEVRQVEVKVEKSEKDQSATGVLKQNNKSEDLKLDDADDLKDTSDVTGEEVAEVKFEDREVPVRVKIWRTPQFNKWYKNDQMAIDGSIYNVEHFDSVCYKYNGIESGDGVLWQSNNDCLLVPDGLAVDGSANGRDESDNLVLRFSASASFSEEFFKFKNKHMIAIGPMGQNVTDSYVQIGGMFTKAAKACDMGDEECLTNTENSGKDKALNSTTTVKESSNAR